jgi:Tol biopolymer transport system component
MNADGSEETELFSNLGAMSQFRWSPDSRRIAYEVVSGVRRQILVGDIESGESSPLTAAGEDARLGDWSPDGDWVVFTLAGNGRSGIYKGNPDGVNEIEVADIAGAAPSWSPNNRWISFEAIVDGFTNIFVVPADGGDETNLTGNAGNNWNARWSRDGNNLVFVSDRDGNEEVYVIDASGRNEARLTSNRVSDLAPSWSKRTNKIAFASDSNGQFGLFTMRPDGSDQRRVGTGSREVADVDW